LGTPGRAHGVARDVPALVHGAAADHVPRALRVRGVPLRLALGPRPRPARRLGLLPARPRPGPGHVRALAGRRAAAVAGAGAIGWHAPPAAGAAAAGGPGRPADPRHDPRGVPPDGRVEGDLRRVGPALPAPRRGLRATLPSLGDGDAP